MKKILVIGPGGAGKSTFATRLGEILELEVVHLDSLYWNPGWVEPRKEEWAATVDAVTGGDAWIVDGNYSGTLERRLAACDAVVFLDLPRFTCVWRLFRRLAQHHNTVRPGMANGCPERLNLSFLLWVWNYRKRTRPKIVSLLNKRAADKEVIWLKSPEQVERYLTHARDAEAAKLEPADARRRRVF